MTITFKINPTDRGMVDVMTKTKAISGLWAVVDIDMFYDPLDLTRQDEELIHRLRSGETITFELVEKK